MNAPLTGPGSAPQTPGRGPEGPQPTSRAARSDAPVTVTGLVVKVVLLGLAAAIAVWASLPADRGRGLGGLALLVATTAGLGYLYLTRRHIPMKYLVPGTLFLIAFQVLPVLLTAATAFTNFADGHRGTKDEAITAIQTASVVQVPDSAEYTLSVATKGDPGSDPLVFLITDPTTGTVVRR